MSHIARAVAEQTVILVHVTSLKITMERTLYRRIFNKKCNSSPLFKSLDFTNVIFVPTNDFLFNLLKYYELKYTG